MCGFSTYCDMVIKNECNINRNSYAWPGDYDFRYPNDLVGSDENTSTVSFLVKNIEVFRVNQCNHE